MNKNELEKIKEQVDRYEELKAIAIQFNTDNRLLQWILDKNKFKIFATRNNYTDSLYLEEWQAKELSELLNKWAEKKKDELKELGVEV